MQAVIDILIMTAAFFFMEFVAWSAHKYVMHGAFWFIHEDHHVMRKGFFQKNDLFVALFAIPSWLFMMFGIMDGCDYKMWIGIGFTIYGLSYFFVHEVVIHNRFNLFGKVQNPYLRGLIKAHAAHHKHKGPENGECFGMLIVLGSRSPKNLPL